MTKVDLNPEFSFLAPKHFLVRRGKDARALLRQVLPLKIERQKRAQFSIDPLAERKAEVLPGLLHKYHGRVLLLVTNQCAIHCRYCFRRHALGQPCLTLQPQNWQRILRYIRDDHTIHEVILSGGDPLMLKNTQLAQIFADLIAIKHLKFLRIHTRVPTVLPKRINTGLLQIFRQLKLLLAFVLHCNHAAELNQDAILALKKLRALSGVTLLNQSVLLKGVNDDVLMLQNLSRKLFASGVLPYYLHLLDPVAGVGHFFVPQKTAQHLMKQLRASLPGYLVPRLVVEKPGDDAKMVLG